MSKDAWPKPLQEIAEMFKTAPRQDRLHYLLEFAESLPELPPELEEARDQMEQVHECQSPVFLHTTMEDGKVYYHIDVPREAPTVRGFASILYEGLNGATLEEIEATPKDLYDELGLDDVLSPQRLRGLTALLIYMKRSARRLAKAA
ncbi:MAG: SufE family protein [Chloroflexota bacterium]|nr:SufE family protein [Chloroflexota bacterium]